MRSLLIKQPWIDLILDGAKTWELRGSRTRIRGPIALIQSGSGQVVGTCEVVDVKGPLSLAELRRTTALHCVPASSLRAGMRYKNTFAWVLSGARRSPTPVKYDHPPGAIIWVKLDQSVQRRIRRQT